MIPLYISHITTKSSFTMSLKHNLIVGFSIRFKEIQVHYTNVFSTFIGQTVALLLQHNNQLRHTCYCQIVYKSTQSIQQSACFFYSGAQLMTIMKINIDYPSTRFDHTCTIIQWGQCSNIQSGKFNSDCEVLVLCPCSCSLSLLVWHTKINCQYSVQSTMACNTAGLMSHILNTSIVDVHDS